MKIRIKHLPIVAALACSMSVGNANADDQVFNAGIVGQSLTVHTFIHQAGSFFDSLNFSVSSPSVLSGSVSNLTLSLGALEVLNISGLTAVLWDNHHPDGITNFGSFAGNNATVTFNLPTAGDYHLDVYGTATGLSGGIYSAALSAAPVPEPESYAMLLAGLGMLGFMARRRIKG